MRKFLVGFSALGVLLYAAPAFAGIALSATGNVPPTLLPGPGLISPPANAVTNTSLTYQIWNEQAGTLSAPLALDNNGAVNTYSGLSPGTPTTLAAGTPFGTTYVQLNPGVNGTVNSGVATILFSSKIIGLALSPSNLIATNVFGAPGTTYYSGGGTPNNNGGSIVGKNNQFFAITDGGRELEVGLAAQFDGFKDVRVFTANNSSVVPEPASLIVWSVLGTVLTGGAWWPRQRPAV
jgi:hypothetical protein